MTRSCLGVVVVAALTFYACGDDTMKMGDPTGPECSDGVDNDGDGAIDFPDDPGCIAAADDSEDSLTAPECADGRDNDGDGKTDYPTDPGCSVPNQEGEQDDCPSGPNCPECSNGIDDDGANGADYPNDTLGCQSAADPDESVFDPNACGQGTMIVPLPLNGMANGMFNVATSSSQVTSGCGEVAGVPAVAYEFIVEENTILTATTNDGATTGNTVLDIRRADCAAPAASVVCNDDISIDIVASALTAELAPGKYYAIVKGKTAAETGSTYTLTVTRKFGEDVPCTTTDQCGTGLVCRTPVGGSAMVCTQPACNDGADSDSDGKNDFPTDPGCTSTADNDETDDCPTGPNCPVCSDGIDNDNDSTMDYPMDVSCTSAAGNSESCNGEQDPIDTLDGPTLATTMIGMNDDRTYTDACSSVGMFQPGGLDRVFTVTVPATRSITFDTATTPELDTVLTLLPPTCAEPSLACNDDFSPGFYSSITYANLPAGQYVLAVDTYNGSTPPSAFNVNITGTLEQGASCEPANTLGGALSCPASSPCTGAAGSRVCAVTVCNDAIDADGDGHNGYPTDPGCTSIDDTDEADTCPAGPGCPQCSDGIDNDGTGGADYGVDPDCESAADNLELLNVCMETDPVGTIVGPTTVGIDTTTLANDMEYDDGLCGGFFGSGNDVTYLVTLPATQSVHFDLGSSFWDIVMALHPPTDCTMYLGGVCEDSESLGITVSGLPAGTYVLRLDEWSSFSSPDTFSIFTDGILAVGESCEPGNTLGGALVCPAANPCTGTAGARTCQ